jgi:hypothetical protein
MRYRSLRPIIGFCPERVQCLFSESGGYHYLKQDNSSELSLRIISGEEPTVLSGVAVISDNSIPAHTDQAVVFVGC